MNVNRMAEALLLRMERMPRSEPQRAMGMYARGEVFLLNYLLAVGGTARPNEMCQAIGVSTARVAAAVNSMERKGWVFRQTDPEDHRKTLVHATSSGEAHALAYRRHILHTLHRLLTALGEEDAHEYIRILDRIDAISEAMRAEDAAHPAGKETEE